MLPMLEETLEPTQPLLNRSFTPGEPVILWRWILLRALVTTPVERKQTGAWWHRELLGAYAPTAMRAPDGRIAFESEP